MLVWSAVLNGIVAVPIMAVAVIELLWSSLAGS
jgi:hypothetical protein